MAEGFIAVEGIAWEGLYAPGDRVHVVYPTTVAARAAHDPVPAGWEFFEIVRVDVPDAFADRKEPS